MTRGTIHTPAPQFVPMFRRYQCSDCHSWAVYNEWIGRWFHERDMQEELKRWAWDGSTWEWTP